MSEFSNNNHPEIRHGEVFHCNTANREASQFDINSKRVGNIAYDSKGEVINGLVPVFISCEDEARILIKKLKGRNLALTSSQTSENYALEL